MELKRSLIIMMVITITNSGHRGKRANHCSLDDLNILNGSFEVKSGGGSIVYECNHGYSMLGVPRLFCVGSIWSNRLPRCITDACHAVSVQRPLRVQDSKKYGGALLEFSCEVMYKLVGRKQISCDGTSWSATAPTCEPFSPPMKCDFEDAGLCGWEHHDSSDVRWALHSGNTKTSRTGPSYDHSIGARGTGHYMYFETSKPTQKGHKAVLISPLYPGNYSGRCFSFWLHLLAGNDVSLLQVTVKPDSDSLHESREMFVVKANKGDNWIENTFQVPDLHEPFQILFIATRGASIRSDIAIDDVSLHTCPETSAASTTVTETSTSRNSTKTTKHGTTTSRNSTKTTKHGTTTSRNSVKTTKHGTTTPRNSAKTNKHGHVFDITMSSPAREQKTSESSSEKTTPSTHIEHTFTTKSQITSFTSTPPSTIRHKTSLTTQTHRTKLGTSFKKHKDVSTSRSTTTARQTSLTSTRELPLLSVLETSTRRSSSYKTSSGSAFMSSTTTIKSTIDNIISIRTTGVKMPVTAKENTVFTLPNPTSGISSLVPTDHATNAAVSKDVGTNNTVSTSSDVLNYHSAVKGHSTDTTYLFIGIGIGLTLLVLLAFLLYYRLRRKRESYGGYLEASNPLYVALNGDHSEALIKTFDKSHELE